MWIASQKTQRRAAICLAVAGAILFLTLSIRPAAGELSYGYATYYTAARLVRDGVGTDSFYDREWFREQTVDAGFGPTSDIFHVNPPPTALLLYPLSSLAPGDADIVWTLVTVVLLGLALAVVADTLGKAGFPNGPRRAVFWCGIALVTVYNPLWENIRFGQVYVLLLLLLSFVQRAYVLEQRRRLGIFLGLMFAAKSAGAVLWGLLLLGRRFRSLAWGAGTIIAAVLVTSPILGFSMWMEYVQRLPELFNQPWSGVTAYQTTTSFIHHNLHAGPRSNGSPIVDWPSMVVPLTTASNLVLFGFAALAGWGLQREMTGERLRLARFGLLSALMIPLQPLGEEYHFVLVLPAVFSALLLALAEPPGARREVMLMLAVVGTLLLATPLHQTNPSLSPGFRALLAYPKLYGALMIAGAMSVQLVIAPASWRAWLTSILRNGPVAIPRPSAPRQRASGRYLPDQSPRP